MTLKRSIRRKLDRAARAGGLVRLLEQKMVGGLTVLAYHRVLPADRCSRYPFPALAIAEDVFREQVRELAARFDVVPVGEALRALAANERRARPLVALSFDDGYADNHDLAAPILEKQGLRATFFPTTGFVAWRRMLWFDRAALALAGADLDRRSRAREHARTELGTAFAPPADGDAPTWIEFLKYVPRGPRLELIEILEGYAGRTQDLDGFAGMTPSDVADLARRGHEIGSHSVDHEILPILSDARLHWELVRSREELEAWTGSPVRGLCYPNGDHDERVAAAARAAGYAFACTTRPGLNRPGCDPLRLTRIDVTPPRVCTDGGGHDPDAFRAELCGLHELMR